MPASVWILIAVTAVIGIVMVVSSRSDHHGELLEAEVPQGVTHAFLAFDAEYAVHYPYSGVTVAHLPGDRFVAIRGFESNDVRRTPGRRMDEQEVWLRGQLNSEVKVA